jgi:DNA topoisomerase VI subunit A
MILDVASFLGCSRATMNISVPSRATVIGRFAIRQSSIVKQNIDNLSDQHIPRLEWQDMSLTEV